MSNPRKKLVYPLSFALLGALAGCGTELQLKRAGDMGAGTDPGVQKPYTGIPYPVMFTTFQIDVKHRVISCDKGNANITTSVEIQAPVSAPDMTNMFLLDPNSLSGPFKSGSVAVSYLPNGAISGLNASADDKSVAIAANIVGGLVKVASVAFGVAGAGDGQPAIPSGPIPCSAPVLTALKALDKDNPVMERAQDKLEKANAAYDKIRAKADAMGGNTDEGTRQALGKAVTELGKAQAELAKAAAVVAKSTDRLTITKSTRWPTHSNEWSGEIRVLANDLEKWAEIGTGKPGDLSVRMDPTEAAKGLDVYLALEAAYPQPAQWKRQDGNVAIDAKQGLPYRLPQPGRIKACKREDCDKPNQAYAEKVASVLQLGDVYYMPCRSPAFTSASCALTYADTGELKTMGAARTTASAEQASAAFKDTATQYSDYRAARRAAEAKADGAELASLKAQAELEAAKAALLADPQQAILAETAAVNAAAGLAKARLTLIETDIALTEARKKVLQ